MARRIMCSPVLKSARNTVSPICPGLSTAVRRLTRNEPFHDFLMRHGKMHGFRHIAFDDTMVYSATDVEGKRNMSELLIPLNYLMMPNNYAIKPIE